MLAAEISGATVLYSEHLNDGQVRFGSRSESLPAAGQLNSLVLCRDPTLIYISLHFLAPGARSVWIRFVRVGDADSMISEAGVHAGDFHLRHMAGDAVFCADGAACAGMIVSRFFRW